jgi:CheY-like chemotaxis protein
VPRILVADDNSNIQKMVGLALKDQGIDVVAVGNGEAAVRKISDIKPDLVLADVFMPVRNGYEVCKYVKDDASLAHIPVILLVGAFDPLDEQEAQRVGADGVLKKPFVPPDPLISMVKSALARAGVAYDAAKPAEKAPQPGAIKSTETPHKAAPPIPMVASSPIPEPSREFVPVLEEQSFVDEVRTGPVPVKIDSASQPLAFGSLLESPGAKETEDMDFVPPSNAGLVPERDWSLPAEVEEDPEETVDEPKLAWRRDATDEVLESSAPTRPVEDWRDTAIANAPAQKSTHGGWQPSKETKPLTEAAEVTSRSNGVATEIHAVTTSEAPSPSYTSSSPAADAWAKAIALAQEEKPVEMASQVEAQSVVEAPAEVSAAASEKSSESAWHSAPSSPWDSVAEKANKLASTWDAAVVAAPVVEEKNGAVSAPEPQAPSESELETEQLASPSDAYSTESLLTKELDLPEPGPEKIVQEELAPLIPELPPLEAPIEESVAPAEPLFSETSSVAETEAVKEATAKSESQDDLVARVLAKMSPELLQAVTREILKPVVEAMVKEELNSKK